MISTNGVSADPNAQARFEHYLRQYFSNFNGGQNVIRDIHYTHVVDSDYTRANRTDRPGTGEDIEFEIAYIRVFDHLLCRVGIGYASMGRFEYDVDPAVFAECVPMTADQRNVITSADLLPDRFDVARAALLGSKRSVISAFPEFRSAPDAVGFTFEGMLPRLKATRLFFMVGGPDPRLGNHRAQAVHAAKVTTIYENDNKRTEEIFAVMWEINLARSGKDRYYPNPSGTSSAGPCPELSSRPTTH